MTFTAFERRWLLGIFAFLIPSNASEALPLGAADVELSGFVDELVALAPGRMLLGLRICLWILVLSPPFVLGRMTTFFGLDDAERATLIARFRASDRYLLREMPLLFKTVGALGWGGHPRVHALIGIEPRDSRPPSWADQEHDE